MPGFCLAPAFPSLTARPSFCMAANGVPRPQSVKSFIRIICEAVTTDDEEKRTPSDHVDLARLRDIRRVDVGVPRTAPRRASVVTERHDGSAGGLVRPEAKRASNEAVVTERNPRFPAGFLVGAPDLERPC